MDSFTRGYVNHWMPLSFWNKFYVDLSSLPFLARLASSNEGSFANVAWFAVPHLDRLLLDLCGQRDRNLTWILAGLYGLTTDEPSVSSLLLSLLMNHSASIQRKTKVVVLMFLTLSHSNIEFLSSIGWPKSLSFSLGWYGNT